EHAPRPSQRPLCPQSAAPPSLQILCGSALPASTLRHMPSMPRTLQAVHAPAHATAQQTPSTQKLDEQSAATGQPARWACGGWAPQPEFTRTAGDPQSVPPAAHVARHAGVPVAVLHLYGAHEIDFCATHAPCPSHAEPGTTVDTLHAGALHWVPMG